MKWIKTNEKLPSQGLKVLCFHAGDLYVAQRFNYENKSVWLPIPFCDSQFAFKDEPTLWSYIDFPKPYKGKLLMARYVNGEIDKSRPFMDMDEYEEEEYEKHQKLVKMMIDTLGKPLPPLNQ